MTEADGSSSFDGARPASAAKPAAPMQDPGPTGGIEAVCSAESSPAAALVTGSQTPDGRALRWRGDRLITLVIAALVLGGGLALWHIRSSHDSPSRILLPSTLLGANKVSGSDAQQAVQNLVDDERANSDLVANPVAAIYGYPGDGSFAVLVGRPNPGILPTAQQAVQDLRAQGNADATAFAPGPPGGLLMCVSSTGQGGVQCSWIDQTSAGDVLFTGRNPSTLAAAPAKSRQVRDALEH
jgi:hypothetical protein